METLSLYQDIKTRIIPGLNAPDHIVAMPHWTWFWLDDFMRRNSVLSYPHMYQALGQRYKLSNDNLIDTLKTIAEIHAEYSMKQVHNLANDNGIEGPQGQHFITRILPHRSKQHGAKRKEYNNMPRIYKLFSFIPCATTSQAVWERKSHINVYQEAWYDATILTDADTDTDTEA